MSKFKVGDKVWCNGRVKTIARVDEWVDGKYGYYFNIDDELLDYYSEEDLELYKTPQERLFDLGFERVAKHKVSRNIIRLFGGNKKMKEYKVGDKVVCTLKERPDYFDELGRMDYMLDKKAVLEVKNVRENWVDVYDGWYLNKKHIELYEEKAYVCSTCAIDNIVKKSKTLSEWHKELELITEEELRKMGYKLK